MKLLRTFDLRTMITCVYSYVNYCMIATMTVAKVRWMVLPPWHLTQLLPMKYITNQSSIHLHWYPNHHCNIHCRLHSLTTLFRYTLNAAPLQGVPCCKECHGARSATVQGVPRCRGVCTTQPWTTSSLMTRFVLQQTEFDFILFNLLILALCLQQTLTTTLS